MSKFMTSTIMTLYFSDNLLRASGKEPCPLDGTEDWQPLLSSLAFSDPDQFGEDETLQGEDQGAKVPGNGNGNDTERRGEKMWIPCKICTQYTHIHM